MSYVESREQDKQANNKNKFIVTENILIVVRLGCGDIEKRLSLTGVREGLKKAVAFELNFGEHKEITKWKISEEIVYLQQHLIISYNQERYAKKDY